MNPSIELDNYIAHRFGFSDKITNKDELFKSKFFTKISIQKEKQFEQILHPEVGIAGDVCTACKSTNTYSYSMQTRSGDEGMSHFTICNNCGARRISK